jgi:predicted ATPase/class 3 adenylate cyclase
MLRRGMRTLPSGTVTFLFTDVEGSTKLLHELGPEGYAAALAEHRRVLRNAFGRHGGIEVDTQGDAFFVAFATAPGAIAAASEAQVELAIPVRMGMHTGTPHLTEEGYVGPDVNRAARIAACGHGGQVLVSAATATLLQSADAVLLSDLGEHRLKDLSAPERIYQLGEREFPPLASLHQTNLPVPATPFLGRERELQEIAALLGRDDVRLLTLTGPGGTGKTRLALQAAGEAADAFPAGVWWVPLAPLRDAELVLETAASAVGAKDGLAEHVADKRLLLLLDNFEHLVEAAAELSELLAACPNLHVLVTSRELLTVPGEQAYPVPPLEPAEGTELFLARARAVKPDFDANGAVAELCARLDHLPLALELAAARVRMLSPEQLLERLETRLDLLEAGRGVDPRQQTLRATIEWSHELLSAEERQLFARLSVFRGGCTLEAAEEVCEAEVDTLQSLVDKSLLRVRDGERFWMLETIREYAAERLEQSGEAPTIRDRHLDYLVTLGERAYEGQRSASEGIWFATLDAEHDNLRAALDWAGGRHPAREAELAGAVAPYWMMRGHTRETQDRLTRALARYDAPDAVRARALTHYGELEDAVPMLKEALRLWHELGDARGEGLVLEAIGWAHDHHGDYEAARLAHEESLAIRARAGVPDLEGALARAGLCHVLVATGEVERAESAAEELLAIAAPSDVSLMQQLALHFLADCPLVAGQYAEAERRYLRALAYARAAGLPGRATDEVLGVAMAAAGQGDAARALRLAGASYAEQERLGKGTDRWWGKMQELLLGAARASLGPEEAERAERCGRESAFDEVLDELLG